MPQSKEPALTVTSDQIKAFRKARKLSQVELAAAVGIARNTMVLFELGKTPIDRRTELALFAVAAGQDKNPPAFP